LKLLSNMPTIAGVTPVEVGAESIKLPVDYIAVSVSVTKPIMHDRASKLGWTVHNIEGDLAILVGDPETTVKLLVQCSSSEPRTGLPWSLISADVEMNRKRAGEQYRKDKVAVVTGAAGGVGRDTSVGLAQAGARVMLADLATPALESVSEGL